MLTRRTPLKRVAFKVRQRKPLPKTGRKSKADRVALAQTKPLVADRAEGVCEFAIPGVCRVRPEHYHHRVTGHANHDVLAVVYICSACHRYVHTTGMTKTVLVAGQLVPESYANGWLVRHPEVPTIWRIG